MSIEQNFNLCKQRKDILRNEGHLLVCGGPGSGKTTIALLKARRIVQNGLKRGQSLLFLSFSNAAIRRIAESATNLLDDGIGSQIDIRTYHSFAWDILRSHGYLISRNRCLKVVPSQDADVRKAGLGDEEWFQEQQRLFEEEGLVTYDQFAPRVVELFRKSPKLLKLYADTFPVVFVDEFQDSDDAQWGIVSELARYSTVIALGDRGQRIYEWRPGVTETRLDEYATALKPQVFDFKTENNRSPNTGLAEFGRALLDPDVELPDCDDISIFDFARYQAFPINIKLALRHAYRRAKEAKDSNRVGVAVAGRSKQMVRLISDALAGSQTAKGKTFKPIRHDVLVDHSQVTLAARVVAFLLEASSQTESDATASTLELVGDLLKSTGSQSGINGSARLRRWATAVRAGNGSATKLVIAIRTLLPKLANFEGSPMQDWLKVRRALEESGQSELVKVGEYVRFLRLLRRGSAIEDALADLWRRNGRYEGAIEAVESALLKEQLLDSVRPEAKVTVMNMHQLKGREFDAVVVVEDQHRTFLGQDSEPPYMDTRRLLQVAITRARYHAAVVMPKRGSTLEILDS